MWYRLSHPNILPLLGYTTFEMADGPIVGLVSEFYHLGNAHEFVAREFPSLPIRTSLVSKFRLNLQSGVVNNTILQLLDVSRAVEYCKHLQLLTLVNNTKLNIGRDSTRSR